MGITTGWTDDVTVRFEVETILEVDLERDIIGLMFVDSLGFGLGVWVATACDCIKFYSLARIFNFLLFLYVLHNIDFRVTKRLFTINFWLNIILTQRKLT